mmetsp:Transcript_14279/g.15406  ORF Transcript_14279/g.15406 Transcript_14279/m.15406 type:complete len:90 (-) Transcript_14279:24-293(-)
MRKTVQIDSILPSDGKVQRWERSPLLIFGRNLFNGRWVRITEASTDSVSVFGDARRLPHPTYAYARPTTATAPQPEFRAFQGSGHRLGR